MDAQLPPEHRPPVTAASRAVLAKGAAVLALAFALAVSGMGLGSLSGTQQNTAAAASGGGQHASAQELHDRMRKVWEDHITWTRLTIVSFAANLPDLAPTQERLLRNQDDIGDTFRPFYGDAAADRLTALLREHILGAVDLLVAAKGGDPEEVEAAKRAWYANGQEIADFLSSLNPRNWPQDEMRSMMNEHLDLTLQEAVHRLQGDYAADIADYDAIHDQALEMADMLSDGIIAQFPHRFGPHRPHKTVK